MSSIGSITSSITPKPEPLEARINQLTESVTSLTQVVNQIVSRDHSKSSRPAKSSIASSSKCFWDSCDSPRFDECADLCEWVAKGRIERGGKGFVQLKGGQRLPSRTTRYTEGTLKQRFERYFEDHPGERILSWESSSVESSPYGGVSIGQHVSHTGRRFQGPTVMEIASTLLATPVEQGGYGDESYSILNSKVPAPAPPPPEPSLLPPNLGPTPVLKSLTGKFLPNYVPPQERTIGAPSKDGSRKFRYCAQIETEAAVGRAVQAGLSSMVSIRRDDLLAIAPEYRRKVEKNVIRRKTSVDRDFLEAEKQRNLLDRQDVALSTSNPTASEPETDVLPCAQAVNRDLREIFMNKREGDMIYVARESITTRGVTAIIGERPVHCVVAWGCSIIGMSVATCNALGIIYDSTRCISLQSANGDTDWTLGIAKDVPFCFGEVTAVLQVHIVDSSAYDILLGRPFESLTQACTQNFLSGDQHITLTDPKTKQMVTISTVPRKPPQF